MKRIGKSLLLFALMISMILGSAVGVFAKGKDGRESHGNGTIKVTFEFKDAAQAAWAVKYMTSMQIKHVFEGYEDGTFQPNKPIKRIEAITTAVRLLGLEAQAKAEMNAQLNFKDAKQLAKKYPWAVGYVAVAAEQGLFDSDVDKIQAEKPADRLWTATLLVKALKLDGEAKAKMNTQLTFADSKTIPAGSVGYVAVAVEKGIVTGYEDNTFRGNRPVTRAEMSAFLDRTDDKLNQTNPNEVKGTLVSHTDTTVTLQTYANQSVTLPLDAQTYIFIGRNQATLTDLLAGDEVSVQLVDGKVVFIAVKADVEEVEGTVVSVNPAGTVTNSVYQAATLVVRGDENMTYTFTLNSDTKVSYKHQLISWNQLLVGDEVEVKTVRNQVTEVKVDDREKAKFEGVIKSFTLANNVLTAITITDEDNKDWTMAVSSSVRIEKKHRAVSLNELSVGDKVELKAEGSVVTEIKIED